MPDLKPYHYPDVYRVLLAETEEHEMQILHEDGLYRHLRFQKPGTGIYHWDIITWPGSLAIRGDIGEGFIFTRERDMLTWFDQNQAPGWIKPDYWAEKLDRGARNVRVFSREKWAAWLRGDPQRYLPQSAESEVDSVEEAVTVLDDFNIQWDYEDVESWKDFDFHFLLACHAILWGAKRYHAAKKGAGNAD
ncbi:hypothetical protein [Microbacterium sp. No. 7]|uniref:hypothetical protein n=1 Tax=Microbacterium sp. No. 7 TaxID=1714373 RepID=UPI0006D2C715|nr:hypothetical protein [Microbacterium sp. No. 7]